ncbi:hypothetical protein P3W53_03225 [Pseudomonas denitrificans (nom. rej.)]|nr:hypothetical protein [Pseudomonas denitrificans (nom. rej.)]
MSSFFDLIAHSRLGAGAYFDKFGVMQIAGANVPRFDHDPYSLARLGLLLEGARTNAITQSNNFADATWLKANCTVTAGAGVSPDGTANASKLVGASGASARGLNSPVATLSNVQVVGSIFLKAVEYSKVKLTLSNSTTESLGGSIDLAAGTVYQTDAAGTDFTAISVSIRRLKDGWFRCSVTANKAAVNTTVRLLLRPLDNSGAQSGDGTSGVLIFGGQIEAGSGVGNASSYIDTTTSAVTRAGDVANLIATSPWLASNQGTLVAECLHDSFGSAAVAYSCVLGGAGTGGIRHRRNAAATPQPLSDVISDAGATVATFSFAGAIVQGVPLKQAVSYGDSNFRGAARGALGTAVLTGAVPTLNRMSLGAQTAAGSASLFGWLRRVRYYPRQMTDAELMGVTA